MAFRIPNTFRRLFAEGTFNAAFIPSYISAKTESKSEGKKFSDDVLNLLIFILLIIVLIVEIFTPFWFILLRQVFIVMALSLILQLSLRDYYISVSIIC